MEPEKLIGKKVYGFKFESVQDKCIFVKEISHYIGKKGVIKNYNQYNKCFKVLFYDGCTWHYPADQIEAHLVEDEIPTFTKEQVLDLLQKRLLSVGIVSSLEATKIWFKQYENEPTKEEQLTAILGSSEKVSEIMELFKN